MSANPYCIACEKHADKVGAAIDCANCTYTVGCPHDNVQTFCGMLGCLDCDKWLDTVPADPKL